MKGRLRVSCGAPTRGRLARDSAVLALGSAANGAFAYLFILVTTRALGAATAAPVLVLWTYWSMAAAVFTFPLQHWVIRTLAAERNEDTVARTVRWIWLASTGIAVLTGLVAYAARRPLFHDDGGLFPVVLGTITSGACLTGLVRGALTGRRRYAAAAGSMAGENGLRVVLALVAALAGWGISAFALALVAGSMFGLLWRSALRFRRVPEPVQRGPSPLSIMSGVAAGSLIAQIVLTGGPVLLGLAGGEPEQVTSLFVAMAVLRAPYLVALGVTPQLTHTLTERAVHGGRLGGLRRTVVIAVGAAAALAGLAGGTVLGPALQLVFGADVTLPTGLLALLGVGTALALGCLCLLLVLLAYGQPRRATVGWLVALAACSAWAAAWPRGPLGLAVSTFVVAEAVGLMMLLVFARPPTRPTVTTSATS
jgi:hypothetical protein